MFEEQIAHLQNRIVGADAYIQKNGDKVSPNLQKIRNELYFRKAFFEEAEKRLAEACKHAEKQDDEGLVDCLLFLKQYENEDGPVSGKIPFKTGFDGRNNADPERLNGLISAIVAFQTPQAFQNVPDYQEKLKKLQVQIAAYILYHREKYYPTVSSKSRNAKR